SSRRRHTRFSRDWSSDVCSSDLSLLVTQERKRKADLLAYLNEVDRRKLYAKEGYSSLFRYLTEKHRYSESSALKRIQAARLASQIGRASCREREEIGVDAVALEW